MKSCKKHQKPALVILFFLFICSILMLSACADKKEDYSKLLSPNDPVTIEIWNYYSGLQANEFDALVSNFNDGYGRKLGIIVTTTSQSSIGTLAEALIKAIDEDATSEDLPDLVAVYPETAFILKEKNAIVPVEKYLSEEEWDEYVPSFLETGRFSDGGEIYGFPVSKSTEIITINKTDWASFEAAKGVKISDIVTAEDLAEAAKKYYEWTDSLTPDVAEDGKALYGRDSLANYLFIGANKLGHDISKINEDGTASVNLDKETFRTLWKNFYIPFINGYYGHYDKFRSGDLKTGKILAFTGSSSGVNYIQESVTGIDEKTHNIELLFTKPLKFKDQVNDSFVQQGASFYVVKSDEKHQYAATIFLKWFTEAEQNVSFSVNVGYSPVKKDANKIETLTEAMNKQTNPNQKVLAALTVSSDIFNNSTTYAAPAFEQAKDLRSALETAFNDVITKDRAKVVADIASGKTREEATAEFEKDSYFDAWYNDLVAYVNNGIMK